MEIEYSSAGRYAAANCMEVGGTVFKNVPCPIGAVTPNAILGTGGKSPGYVSF